MDDPHRPLDRDEIVALMEADVARARELTAHARQLAVGPFPQSEADRQTRRPTTISNTPNPARE
jgi:hypothetical protein